VQIESLGHLEVKLDSGTLPEATQRVLDLDVNLQSIINYSKFD